MSTVEAKDEPASVEREIEAIAIEAYVYAYPLVTMEITRRQMTNLPVGARPGFGPANQFSHIGAFPDADFKAVVRPNFDTLYSSAWLDLSQGPMIVSAPDTRGRYYMLPMLDMWTDVFAVPGKRTTGTLAARFLVAPPGWRGEAPDGMETIHAPTPTAWIIGRTQTNGPADYDAVHAIQAGFTVSPLAGSDDGTPSGDPQPDPSVDMQTPPLDQVNAMSGPDYFAFAAELMKRHPPHRTDWSTVARIRRIGLRPGQSFDYGALDAPARDAVDVAPQQALDLMHQALPRLARVTNGWQMNTDSMGVYGNFYLKRAIVSMVGLGANQPEDAIYPLNAADADGQPLNGDNDYVLHFDAHTLPPVGAFWSVTMYDSDGFQAANPINRFAIGDRDDLAYNDDGSLDLFLQHDSPGAERESNWLPAPRGPLGVTMRLYAPAPEALDGRWNPPAIRRAPDV
jgi:hypothetical protein